MILIGLFGIAVQKTMKHENKINILLIPDTVVTERFPSDKNTSLIHLMH